MTEDPQLLALRLLRDRLLAHNLRGVRVSPAPGGMVEIHQRALLVAEVPGPGPAQDGAAWAEATARQVLARIAPHR